jgi:Ca2+/Na+ antiporter
MSAAAFLIVLVSATFLSASAVGLVRGLEPLWRRFGLAHRFAGDVLRSIAWVLPECLVVAAAWPTFESITTVAALFASAAGNLLAIGLLDLLVGNPTVTITEPIQVPKTTLASAAFTMLMVCVAMPALMISGRHDNRVHLLAILIVSLVWLIGLRLACGHRWVLKPIASVEKTSSDASPGSCSAEWDPMFTAPQRPGSVARSLVLPGLSLVGLVYAASWLADASSTLIRQALESPLEAQTSISSLVGFLIGLLLAISDFILGWVDRKAERVPEGTSRLFVAVSSLLVVAVFAKINPLAWRHAVADNIFSLSILIVFAGSTAQILLLATAVNLAPRLQGGLMVLLFLMAMSLLLLAR